MKVEEQFTEVGRAIEEDNNYFNYQVDKLITNKAIRLDPHEADLM